MFCCPLVLVRFWSNLTLAFDLQSYYSIFRKVFMTQKPIELHMSVHRAWSYNQTKTGCILP